MTYVALRRRHHAAVRRARPLIVFVMLAALLGQLAAAPATAKEAPVRTAEFQSLVVEAQAKGRVRVIVALRSTSATEAVSPDSADEESQRRGIAQAQEAVLGRLAGKNVQLNARYQFVPFLALSADAVTLQTLAVDPNVVSVQEDRKRKPALRESVPLIGGSATGTFGAAGRTGAGQSVAILDTGVMKSHAFLTGKVVSEGCYSTTDTTEGSRALCISDSTAPGSGVNCSATIDGCEHGTHVAGIVAGKAYTGQPSGPFNGVAKDATLIAFQVFSRYSDPEVCGEAPTCVSSFDSDQMKALERVYALRTTYKIAAVNMSLGGDVKMTRTCDTEPLKPLIDKLITVGIATVIASGNEYYTNGVGSPGCISTAVTVGSTTKADVVSDFSNSAPMVDLLAPGSDIRSSVVTSAGAFALQSGTSMATPHVAGAWAVMKQQKPTASVNEVLAALQNTGKPITDRRNGLVKKRIQLAAAVNSLTTTTNPVPVLASISPNKKEAGFPAFTMIVTGSNFVPTSVVRWKGVARPTTFVSATQLRAAISKADIAVAGTAPVTVFSPTPGGGTSAAATFTISPMTTAPRPTVTSLAPASRLAGSTAFTLVVKGTNFVPRSVVRWAGVARTTTYVSATELRAAIAAADIATQGTKAVTVFTAAPGGGLSNAVNFVVTASATTPCSLDEPNNTIAAAKLFAPGTIRKYGICTVGDKDYIKIDGVAGSTYTIDALSPAAALDLVIEVFDASGPVFEPVDEGAEGVAESVALTVQEDGPFYVAFSEYDNDQGNSTFTYTVRVTVE